MRYLLDTHIISSEILRASYRRDDLYVLSDVVGELGASDVEIQRVSSSRLNVIDLSKKHLEKLKEIMVKHGNNFKLINLFTGKGTADVAMLAYVLSEKESPDTLFQDDYTIITNDKELTTVAESYGINCLKNLPN